MLKALKALKEALAEEWADKSNDYSGAFVPWDQLSDEEKGLAYTDERVLADAERDAAEAKEIKQRRTRWG